MSIISNKNVNNQSSLSVDTVNITSLSSGSINTNEDNTKLLNILDDSNNIITSIDNLGNVNNFSDSFNLSTPTKIILKINNSEVMNLDSTGLFIKDSSGTTTLNITTTNNIISPNNIIIKSEGFTVKNNAGTSTYLDVNSNGITKISSVNYQPLFNRAMATNTNTYSSSKRGFAAGVKVINISFQHYATTAGVFECKLFIRNNTDVNLQSVVTRRYTISTPNVHQMFSFHYLTEFIDTLGLGFYVTVSMIPIAPAVFASDPLMDSITGIIYNLANVE